MFFGNYGNFSAITVPDALQLRKYSFTVLSPVPSFTGKWAPQFNGNNDGSIVVSNKIIHMISRQGTEKYTVRFFEVHFLAALASWLCRLHSFWLFLADQLGKNFGQQFFSWPRYVVNLYCLLSDKFRTNNLYWFSDQRCKLKETNINFKL
jgi:hypothetical protein